MRIKLWRFGIRPIWHRNWREAPLAVLALGLVLLARPGMAAGAGDQRLLPQTPAGSGATPAAASGTSIPHSTAADALVLRIEARGGLLPPGIATTELPQFSLYGDGRVITLGPQIQIYPPPALPNIQVARINEAGIQAVLHLAADAGLLDSDQTYSNPSVMDAPTTVFTVDANGKTTMVAAAALGIGEETLPADEQAARAKLIAFSARVTDVEGSIPGDVVAPSAAYPIDRLQVIAAPMQASAATPELEQPPMDWPLATPLSQFGSPVSPPIVANGRCGLVTGADATRLVDALGHANSQTPWRSEGALYSLYPRPLLPDEQGCPVRSAGTPAASPAA